MRFSAILLRQAGPGGGNSGVPVLAKHGIFGGCLEPL